MEEGLDANALAPKPLILVITEHALQRSGSETARTLRALQAIGVAIALADFDAACATLSR